VLFRSMATPPEFCGPVNLGNPEEITIYALAKRIIALSASRSELVFGPLPEDDPVQRCPDITLAGKELNWVPTISLDAGLRKTLDYFAAVL